MAHIPSLKFIIPLCFSLFITSCFPMFDGRTNTLVLQKTNPAKRKKAILFSMEAPSVSFSYQVSIVADNHKLDDNDVGNTFTVDTNHGDTFLDSSSIHINWLGNDTLLIDYDKKLRTFIMEKMIDGTVVLYKER